MLLSPSIFFYFFPPLCFFPACIPALPPKMACLFLGSKSEQFHLEDHNWSCATGLPSDVTIELGEMSFNLHKFPLLSKSGVLAKLIDESPNKEGGAGCVLQLHELPGGAKAFELVAKFCYGVKIEVTAQNVISLRCAADFLVMTEDYGEGNLVSQTENFLNEIFSSWPDSMKALESCEVVLSYAEDLHLVSRCIDSLAIKACTDPSLFTWGGGGGGCAHLWNGISTSSKPQPMGDDWWYGDVSYLNLPLYKRLVIAIEAKGMKAECVAGSLVFYLKRYLPLINRQPSFKDANSSGGALSTPSEADQRSLLEEIVELMPRTKGVTSAKFMVRLLRAAMLLHASPACRENLERRVGSQLDQATLDDLLIPNIGYSVETLHDIDCVQRILDHFLAEEQLPPNPSPSFCEVEEGHMAYASHSLTPITMVAALVDEYLAEVANDVNLKPPRFQSLAAAIPDFARPLYDGVYHSVDIYLKTHAWLGEGEREQMCKLLNCQKLSIEASTHAAQNERLPLRVIIQVLFFEQLRLRTTVSGWFLVSENGGEKREEEGGEGVNGGSVEEGGEDVEVRMYDLEKECLMMRRDIEKLMMKTKKNWNIIPKRLGFGLMRPQICSSRIVQFREIKAATPPPALNGRHPPLL